MREIKFRIHDEKTGKILAYEVFNTNINRGYFYLDAKELEENGGESICHAGSEYFKHPKSLGIVRRVLFTGLLDRHGKEIFEGDILKLVWSKTYYLEVRWGKVGWVLFSTLFKRIGFEDGDCCNEYNTFDYIHETEICGNIFENPELVNPCPAAKE